MKVRIHIILIIAAALVFIFAVPCIAEDELYTLLQYPSKSIDLDPDSFCIAEDGSLMFQSNDGRFILSGDQWITTELASQTVSYDVTCDSGWDWVIQKDGETIYVDQGDYFFHTLYVINDSLAYATEHNKVYELDLTTGIRKAICNIDGFTAGDWINCLLVSDNIMYAIQTQIPMAQAIDLNLLSQAEQKTLNIAVTSQMDIGNAVLDLTEQLFNQQYPNTMVALTRITPDQCRLDLMSDPSAYDLIIADPLLWDDLAQAGIFEDLEIHSSLAEAWQGWIDMSTVCRYQGKLYGTVLWDNAEILWCNEELLPLLTDVIWPDADWTWDDFLTLARACCRDLNGDGKNDIYIAYQRMFHAYQTTISYSLPVHQAALLYLHGAIDDLECDEVLGMLRIWKTLWEEGLLYPEDASTENSHNSVVVFGDENPIEFFQYQGISDIRLTLPGLSETMRCVPSSAVLMSVNANSAHMEEAIALMECYMLYGADKHNYLIDHDSQLKEFEKNPAWRAPDAFHTQHFTASLESLYRDTWDSSLYDFLEEQLTRYLEGRISAEECARLWQEKLQVTQME